jgi:N-acetylglucosamine kinase-like BadF-type ATPase
MLLAVDAGGTSSRAVLADPTGRCVGYGRAGGGNPVSWGPELAAGAIGAAVAGALAQARAAGAVPGPAGVLDLGTVVLAMAGGSAWQSTAPIETELRARGLTGTVTIESDLVATFCSGTAARDGYALIAGTGAAAIRVRDGAMDRTADALGWLVGDAGSGFWIGRRVVRDALAALDGRGPRTSLTGMLLQALGITAGDGRTHGRPVALQQCIDLLYRMRPVELSRFAALAFRAAGVGGDGQGGKDPSGGDGRAGERPTAGGGQGGKDPSAGDGSSGEDPSGGDGQAGVESGAGDAAAAEGPDEVAAGILREATRRLLGTLAAVRVPGLDGPVVLGGGVAHRPPGLAAAIAESFDVSAGPPDVVTVADGALGAAVLALRHGGVRVDAAIFDRLATTRAALRA